MIERFNNIRQIPIEQADQQGAYCLICYNNPSNVIVRPCYHLAMCIACFQIYKDRTFEHIECPCCRIEIDREDIIIVEYANNDL